MRNKSGDKRKRGEDEPSFANSHAIAYIVKKKGAKYAYVELDPFIHPEIDKLKEDRIYRNRRKAKGS